MADVQQNGGRPTKWRTSHKMATTYEEKRRAGDSMRNKRKDTQTKIFLNKDAQTFEWTHVCPSSVTLNPSTAND